MRNFSRQKKLAYWTKRIDNDLQEPDMADVFYIFYSSCKTKNKHIVDRLAFLCNFCSKNNVVQQDT